MVYLATFERIGRNHAVHPLHILVKHGDFDAIAQCVYKYARKFLMSRDVEVVIEGDGMDAPTGGTIFCGCQVGGTFTLEELSS